ncbi:MAG: hypothetical protein ACPG5P_01260, partial [Saprospiraceae bacterium]
MNKNKIIATIITLFVAMAALGLAFGIYGMLTATQEEPKTEETTTENVEKDAISSSVITKEIPSVKTMEVQNKAVKSGFSVQGRLRAYDKAEIVSEVPGMMKTLDKHFKLGTRYSKGETM